MLTSTAGNMRAADFYVRNCTPLDHQLHRICPARLVIMIGRERPEEDRGHDLLQEASVAQSIRGLQRRVNIIAIRTRFPHPNFSDYRQAGVPSLV